MAKCLHIVDNQMDIILFIKERSKGLGYEITTTTRQEGLEVIVRQPIDRIFA